jgi:anti-sigma regulatory factor (Ser/Thr protein kinase)
MSGVEEHLVFVDCAGGPRDADIGCVLRRFFETAGVRPARDGYDAEVTAESWMFPAAAEAPSLARRSARAYAVRQGADVDTVAAIALCVSEAVTNVVVHAYREADEPGEVELEARKRDGYLCFYVRDQGQGLSPRVDSPGIGLGLPVIADSATSLEVRRPERGGTELVMRFDLTGSTGAAS